MNLFSVKRLFWLRSSSRSGRWDPSSGQKLRTSRWVSSAEISRSPRPPPTPVRQADLSVVLPALSCGSTLPSTARLPPRRGREARALPRQIFGQLGVVSRLNQLYRSAT